MSLSPRSSSLTGGAADLDPAPPSKRRSRRIQRENAVKIAIAEVARERAEARRRARLCVQWTYNGTRVAGVLTQLLVGGVQVWILGWGHAYDPQEVIERGYLIVFSLAALLAELETPFARRHFRALQKWWFKGPFYVFMAFLNMQRNSTVEEDVSVSLLPGQRGLELACLILLSVLAVVGVILHAFLREILEKTVFKKKKRSSANGKERRRSSRKGQPPSKSPVGPSTKLKETESVRSSGYGAASSGRLKGKSTPNRPVLPRKQDSVKWWVEEDDDAFSAASSSDNRSSFAGSSRAWDLESDGIPDDVSDITSMSGYRSTLRPVVEVEEVDGDESRQRGLSRTGARVPPALEQRPPPLSPYPASIDEEIDQEEEGGDVEAEQPAPQQPTGNLGMLGSRLDSPERRPSVNFYNPF